jgi:exonuclease SbcC
MRIERLTIHNFTSLKDVDLDFTELSPGIIALVGQFGSGKSTILEAPIATLYRSLCSRDDELKECATGKDTFLETRFSIDGQGSYRARVNIDGVRGNSDAILEHKPGTPRARFLNDGKVTTYDQAVRARFPSKDLMLAAAIATQNKRGNFVTKKPADKARLFSELLGQGALVTMSETAKAIATAWDQAKAQLAAARDELDRNIGGDSLTTVREEEERIIRLQGEEDDRRARLTMEVAALETRLGAMQDEVAAYAAAQQLVQALKGELHERTFQLAQVQHDVSQVDLDVMRDLQATAERYKATTVRAHQATDHADLAARQKHAETIADLDKKIASNQKVLANAEKIRAAVQRIEAITAEQTVLQARLAEARTAKDETLEARRTVEVTLYELGRIEVQLAEAKSDAHLLTRVPFGDKCAEAGCHFVQNAGIAKEQIPNLEMLLEPKAEEERRLAALNATLSARATDISDVGRALATLADERGAQQQFAQHLEHLAAAEAKIAGYETAKAQAVQDLAARRQEIAVSHRTTIEGLEQERVRTIVEIEQRAADARTRATNEIAKLNTSIQRLTADLQTAQADLSTTKAGSERAIGVQQQLAAVRAQLEEAITTRATLTSDLEYLRQRLLRVEFAVARRAALAAKIVTLDTQLIEWRQLHQCLGRDGVPKLEIDAAGPIISQTTNDLLAAAFGPIFSVELVTQQAKADGGMKEALDLLVCSNATGKVLKIGSLSGGEQIIVGEAVLNALALYVNEHAGFRLETAWRDETAGSLNPAARVQYFQMLRRVHALGRYRHLWFVTHNPEIALMADAIIYVADGTARIELPPYGDLARAA